MRWPPATSPLSCGWKTTSADKALRTAAAGEVGRASARWMLIEKQADSETMV
jgi:hypothetical protein